MISRCAGGAALISLQPRKVIPIAAAVIAAASLFAIWYQPALLRAGTLFSLLNEKAPARLPVPVEEVAATDLVDTWGAPRSDNRHHEGIDIFAPLGRQVVSATRGVVFKVGEDNLGGHVVRVLGPGWQWHYYAHLERFADIEAGTVVKEGDVLGYVGNTGNARGTPYHLHYGVYGFLGGARNPYPLLAADKPDSNMKEGAEKRKPAHARGLRRPNKDSNARKVRSPVLRGGH